MRRMNELIDSQKLDFWLKKNLNVLFIGDHGVGKTTAAMQSFKKANLKSMYFSGATMDVFLDFIGVPRVVEENGEPVLKMIRQSQLQDDTIEAIFIDEYNRAPKKMKNAVMELIQFKSVNGREFPNLKVVWAAINENDDVYDVEPLDPAQKDRFHVHYEVDYRPCPNFLESKYGESQTETLLDWWNELTPEIQKTVSPRRLCYAVDFWLEGGDLRDILPQKSNVSKLIERLSSKPIEIQLKDLFESYNINGAKLFINNDNNLQQALPILKNKEDYANFFLTHLSNEKTSNLMNSDEFVLNHVMLNFDNVFQYQSLLKSILTVNGKTSLTEKIRSQYILRNLKNEDVDKEIYKNVNRNVEYYTQENNKSVNDYIITINTTYNLNDLTPNQREKIWQMILSNCPSNLSANESADLLKLIEKSIFQRKSKTNPWNRYLNFIPVLNHLTRSCFMNGFTLYEINGFAPNILKEMRYGNIKDQCFII